MGGENPPNLDRIFQSACFAALDVPEQKALQDLAQGLKQHPSQALRLANTQNIRQAMPQLLVSASHEVEQFKIAHLQYLTPAQLKAREENLTFALFILLAKYQLDHTNNLAYDFKQLKKMIETCGAHLDQVQVRLYGPQEKPEQIVEQAVVASEKYLKFLPLILSKIYVDMAFKLTSAKANTLEELANEINDIRYYWVWANTLLASVIQAIPGEFIRRADALNSLEALKPYTGYLSGLIYYFRFGVVFTGCLYEVMADNSDIPLWQRVKTHFGARKFLLLNDFIWSNINLISFLILTGKELGKHGDFITAAFMLGDALIAGWALYEAAENHKKEMLKYDQNIEELERKIAEKRGQELAGLQYQRDMLIKNKYQCELSWKYKKALMINDIVYSVSLSISYSMLCIFFYLPATALTPASIFMLGMAGAVLCFALNTIKASIAAGVGIAKSQAETQLELKFLLHQFQITNDINLRKQLYIEMKATLVKNDHAIFYQRVKLARSILIDSMVPVLVFVNLMFLPLGPALGIIAAAAVMSIILNKILDKMAAKEPKLPLLAELADKEFKRFNANPNLKLLTAKAKPRPPERFFSVAQQETPIEPAEPRPSGSSPSKPITNTQK